ncbi:MAG TPA: hypothetical protein VE465_25070 [Streptosporangiaceae bacterium]|jgi:hypothetical protein|nr:hypothetical protein [Streptosporangiaceae bacterium]
MNDDTGLTVVAKGARRHLAAGESLTFGRAATCTICLDPHDMAISRLAGEVRRVGEVWFVANRSGIRQLALVDRFGLRHVLAPGRRDPIEGRVRVIVDGTRTTHELVFEGPLPGGEEPATGAPEAESGLPTLAGQNVMLNDADRRALVALFAGYLYEGRRYDPSPKSYAAAAARLGWPRTTLVKRVEYIRTRLTNAGVPNMQGWNALSALAEYALTTGLIKRDDLRLIGRRPGE